MRDRYLQLMERALSAYTDEHILRYFEKVKSDGLTEHGFPRLTANIGILLSHGRRSDLLPLFSEMMDLCCKEIPLVKAANNFSVREIVCCLREVEKAGLVSEKRCNEWRAQLASIVPEACYTSFASNLHDDVRNWALFACVSEYFRQQEGLADSKGFIDLQLSQQLRWFDENGMYKDNEEGENHQPIVYDLVPRMLLSLLLDSGYRGPQYASADELLKKAGRMTLAMQSPNGEVAFGGRSNQFLHNEALLAAVCEYEAKRYAREGDVESAARFKRACVRAVTAIETYLDKQPIRHIKNRFSSETMYGCEDYAYFDKYMITLASFLYVAYLICDESILPSPLPAYEGVVAQTSACFHKLFAKCGGYGLEFDIDADPYYDANGLGRVHREGAPSALCLSCPCPALPNYTLGEQPPFAFSISSAVKSGTTWRFGADKGTYAVIASRATEKVAEVTLSCRFDDDTTVNESYRVTADGVEVVLSGKGTLGLTLPAFCFDGETAPMISTEEQMLTVTYDGWTCRYMTDGAVGDLDRCVSNRNGYYRAFVAEGHDHLHVRIRLEKQ